MSYWYRFVPGAEITMDWYEAAMAERLRKSAKAQTEKERLQQEKDAASARKLDCFKCAFVPDENSI